MTIIIILLMTLILLEKQIYTDKFHLLTHTYTHTHTHTHTHIDISELPSSKETVVLNSLNSPFIFTSSSDLTLPSLIPLQRIGPQIFLQNVEKVYAAG